MVSKIVQVLFICLILYVFTENVLKPMEKPDSFKFSWIGYVCMVGIAAYFLFMPTKEADPEKEKIENPIKCYADVANDQDFQGALPAKLMLTPADEVDFGDMRVSEYSSCFIVKVPNKAGREITLILDGGTDYKKRRATRLIHYIPRTISDIEARRLIPVRGRVSWEKIFAEMERAGVPRKDVLDLVKKQKSSEKAG